MSVNYSQQAAAGKQQQRVRRVAGVRLLAPPGAGTPVLVSGAHGAAEGQRGSSATVDWRRKGCAVACERAGGKGTWGSDGQRPAQQRAACCHVV